MEFQPQGISPELAALAHKLVATDLKLSVEERQQLIVVAKQDGRLTEDEVRFLEALNNLHNVQLVAYGDFDPKNMSFGGVPVRFREVGRDEALRATAALEQPEVTPDLIAAWKASGNLAAMWDARLDPKTSPEMKAALNAAMAEPGEPATMDMRLAILKKADQVQSGAERMQYAKAAAQLFPADHPIHKAYAQNPVQEVLDGFSGFVREKAVEIGKQYEMDCADFATYMWGQYIDQVGAHAGAGVHLPGKFKCYTKDNESVAGVNPKAPTMFNGTMYAALFEKEHAELIPEGREGTAKTGITFQAGGRTYDFGDVKPGDILFFGDENGAIHTMLVYDNNRETGKITLLYGNYSSEGGTFDAFPIKYVQYDYSKGAVGAFKQASLMGIYQVKSF